MEHLIIGLTVGIIMGLTGAGGALISIPLFILMLNASLKQATVLSLIAVVFGTSLNLFGHQHKTNKKMIAYFIFFGAISNFASLPLKAILPDISIAVFLTIIGVYSLWSVWRNNQTTSHNSHAQMKPLKMVVTGLILGVITTLTGLGGGVILVPILINQFKMSYEEALPNSLLTILLISSIYLLSQREVAINLLSLSDLGKIGLGALTAFFVLKYFLKKVNKNKVILTRQVVFTLVTVYSIVSIFIKSI